jgi:hypothetical protein
MTLTERRVETTARLMDLERMVDSLNGQLRAMQRESPQAKAGSLAQRFWRNLLNPLLGSEFMSAVCNRRARPNTKAVDHAGTIND